MSRVLVAVCGVIVAVLGFIQFQETQKSTATTNPAVQNPAGPTARALPADTCIQGFVWREAYAGDHVCVTSDERQRVAADNAAAPTRVDPNGPYGADSCIDGHGWVWRDARPGDHVCVSGEERDRAAADDAAAASRIAH